MCSERCFASLAATNTAAWLKKQGVWIRHAIHLDMTPEDATRSVTGIRFDPLNGDMYHVDGTLAPRIPADADVMGRLAVHPKHEPAYVRQGLKVWASKKEGLLKAYANVLSVEDGLREARIQRLWAHVNAAELPVA